MLFNQGEQRNIHFIGIGGIGMCGLAEVLLHQGYQVSGSDQVSNAITARLIQLGAHIMHGHDAMHVNQADVVIYSSAVQADNPELQIARERGLSIWRRGELLAKLMAPVSGIAIAGTHGKTTTTGMISHVLANTVHDPVAINGGIMQGGESTVHLGRGNYLIAEADESDVSFLLLQPKIAVITNIEPDHLENYDGDFEHLKQSFVVFANGLPADGLLVCGIDDPIVRELLPQFKVPVVTFGFADDADVRLLDYQQVGLQSCFRLQARGFCAQSVWQLRLPGRHNAQNALAAIAIGQHLAVDEAILQRQLGTFPGIGRRFDLCGQLDVGGGGHALVYTDYGHHPSEIAVTIAAVRAAWPQQRMVMVFQPHRYSRTQALLTDFVRVLAQADVVLLLDIYAAGEEPIAGLNGETLYHLLKKQDVNVYYVPELIQLPAELEQLAQANDVIFLQGAGSIGTQVINLLSTRFL